MHSDFLQIRYVKLHFEIEFAEDAGVPANKASALRGGMGEMLLRTNCIRKRDCDRCDFFSECLIQRIMYSQMEIKPKFMSQGNSVGYVLSCEDHCKEVYAGQRMRFDLTLFGKTIVYFAQILDAFFRLGFQGIGKEQARYRIVGITNYKNQAILMDNDIRMDRYQIQMVEDYVGYRMKQLTKGEADDNRKIVYRIRFRSPLSLKYSGERMTHFDPEAILEAVKRRIYILNCVR